MDVSAFQAFAHHQIARPATGARRPATGARHLSLPVAAPRRRNHDAERRATKGRQVPGIGTWHRLPHSGRKLYDLLLLGNKNKPRLGSKNRVTRADNLRRFFCKTFACGNVLENRIIFPKFNDLILPPPRKVLLLAADADLRAFDALWSMFITFFARVSDETIFAEQETRLQGIHAGGTFSRNRDYRDFGWLAFTRRSSSTRGCPPDAMHQQLEEFCIGVPNIP